MTKKSVDLAASSVLGAARVALGILWLHEGFVKLHAGFGRADILLVANGAGNNTRVPGYFKFFAEHLLRPAAGLAGHVVPFVELGLGVALVLGILTLPVALGSMLNLLTYWCSDQLVGQYPIMGALSAVLLIWSKPAARFSVPQWIRSRQDEGVVHV